MPKEKSVVNGSFAERVMKLKEERHETNTDLYKLIIKNGVQVSQQAQNAAVYQRLDKGDLKQSKLVALARHYHVTVDYLVGMHRGRTYKQQDWIKQTGLSPKAFERLRDFPLSAKDQLELLLTNDYLYNAFINVLENADVAKQNGSVYKEAESWILADSKDLDTLSEHKDINKEKIEETAQEIKTIITNRIAARHQQESARYTINRQVTFMLDAYAPDYHSKLLSPDEQDKIFEKARIALGEYIYKFSNINFNGKDKKSDT